MRSQSHSRPFFIVAVAFAGALAVLVTSASARPRHGQSMIREQAGSVPRTSGAIGAGGAGTYAHARPGFIGGSDDGSSIRRRQPRHHGANHPHRRR